RDENLRRGRIADAAEGADGLEGYQTFAGRRERQQQRYGSLVCQDAEPANREDSRVDRRVGGQRAQRRRRPWIGDLLQGVGNRPPAEAWLAAVIEDGTGQSLPRSEACQRQD